MTAFAQRWDFSYENRRAAGNRSGRKLIRGRRALGWSQAELARRAGVRVETLNRLEHGKHAPQVATVDKLLRALNAGQAEADRAKSRAARRGRRTK